MTPDPSALVERTESFRDALPTADKSGRRIWVYPRKPSGPFTTARIWVSAVLLLVFFGGPFVRINGNPLLMMDVLQRKFCIAGQMFWPQDAFLLMLAMVALFVMIVLFTAVYGRVWCGWICPQTVLMEMVFRRIEYGIEGDARRQRELAAAPWTAGKAARKIGKQVLFFALSFACGNVLLMYIIGSDAWLRLVAEPPARHLGGLTAMVLFSLLFYAIFARFREQACTFICPYGRFQSVLLDDNSIVVSYDFRRGEPRGRFAREVPRETRRAAGAGDCIDCQLCVDVCPTGIDIRNGTQMECVNCTACIDACDGVMKKVGFPPGLIRYASLRNIRDGLPFRITPRIIAYTVILLALTGLIVTLLARRTDIETSILRTPGSLYQPRPDGRFSNLYNVKLVNKTSRPLSVEVRLEAPAGGKLTLAGPPLDIPAQQLVQAMAIVDLGAEQMTGGKTPVVLGVYEGGRRIQVIKTNFLGPSR